MPRSIPYDPSLMLGNLIPDAKLKNLLDISAIERPIEAAEEEMNSNIMLRRSLDRTVSEINSLGVDTTEISDKIKEVDELIKTSAKKYAELCVKNLPDIYAKKRDIGNLSTSIESPIDYNKTQIKQMPLAADSLRMNAQYFSFEETKQSSEAVINNLKSFVSGMTSFLGSKRQVDLTGAVAGQLQSQRETNEISGTLVITVTCTHKSAALLAPFILDVDKGIRAWNDLCKQNKKTDKLIKIDDVKNFRIIANEEGTDDEEKMHILSGVAYGSSFVGMVHVLKASGSQSSQRMTTVAASLQAQMETGNWFSSASGGFGIDTSFANDVKTLLSSQSISSTVSIVTMGSIPVIKSNEVQLGVQKFAEFDPAKMMEKLAVASNATASNQASVAERAQSARTGGQMLAIRESEVKSVVTGLAPIDERKNKLLDTDTLMTAFEDYVNKALAGNLGVPIKFYIKSITRAQLAQMWVAKYYPNQYLMLSGDDSEPS
jgi:hypothetical protein